MFIDEAKDNMFVDEVRDAAKKSIEMQEKIFAEIKRQILYTAKHANSFTNEVKYSIFDFAQIVSRVLSKNINEFNLFDLEVLFSSTLTKLEKDGFKLTPVLHYGNSLAVTISW